jgi:hypothetical protein
VQSTLNTVEMIVVERRKQAVAEGLYQAGKDIAMYLGTCVSSFPCILGKLESWLFVHKSLYVMFTSSPTIPLSFCLVVEDAGKKVFIAFGLEESDIQLYVPEPWVVMFLSWLPAATATKENAEKRRIQAQIEKERAAFGISDSEIEARLGGRIPRSQFKAGEG